MDACPSLDEGGEDVVICCQVRSDSMCKIPVEVQGYRTVAVIDTAAEVTIMSDRVYRKLANPGSIIRNVTLNTAGRELQMKGFVVGPVTLTLGGQDFQENIYVAPIEDDLLLGLDFLRRHGAQINLPLSFIWIGGIVIPMESPGLERAAKVANVTVSRTTKVPPNSMAYVTCDLNEELGSASFMVESADPDRWLIPASFYSNDSSPRLGVFNLGDRYLTLHKDQCIGGATTAERVPAVPSEFSEACPVRLPCQFEMGASQPTTNGGAPVQIAKVNVDHLPAHLEDLYSRSVANLSPEQKLPVRDLLEEFQDVFAKSEFDLGHFTEIEHAIDTESAKPVKQRMRPVPLAFVQEEEAHLQKMLDAGVIEPSMSEWSSAPVLVRKRDGSVRWCIDYRALNNVTVKDVFPLPLIEDCTDMLAGQIWFSKLDANSAYYQIRLKESDKKKTAFSTKYGLFQMVRMPFGLCNAPATYSRAMSLVLRGLTWNSVLAFLDDVLALGRSFQEHLNTLREVFTRFRVYQLRLKPKNASCSSRK